MLALHRPWANQQHTLDDKTQKRCWGGAQTGSSDPLARWVAQPMIDDPYQNVRSIICKARGEQVRPSSNNSPKDETTISEAAATSGSR